MPATTNGEPTRVRTTTIEIAGSLDGRVGRHGRDHTFAPRKRAASNPSASPRTKLPSPSMTSGRSASPSAEMIASSPCSRTQAGSGARGHPKRPLCPPARRHHFDPAKRSRLLAAISTSPAGRARQAECSKMPIFCLRMPRFGKSGASARHRPSALLRARSAPGKSYQAHPTWKAGRQYLPRRPCRLRRRL